MGAAENIALADATIGVMTALSVECAAVCDVLGCGEGVTPDASGGRRKYALARVRASDGGYHTVAVALLPDMGNNMAAACTTMMLSDCLSIEHVIMCGIAGAVPNPSRSDEHVRLGDIVVSGEDGVFQYDFDRESPDGIEIRSRPRPPSSQLLRVVKQLEQADLMGKRRWEEHIGQFISINPEWARPSDDTDVLQDGGEESPATPHPPDAARNSNPGNPRVFRGIIASAGKLLKNPTKRDFLRDKFQARAIEMEGSGIADATWLSGQAGYLVVRGTCDYCNLSKNDTWHKYASLVAAAYTRAVIEELSTGPRTVGGVTVPRLAAERTAAGSPPVDELVGQLAEAERARGRLEAENAHLKSGLMPSAGEPTRRDSRTVAGESLIAEKVTDLCAEIKDNLNRFEVERAVRTAESVGGRQRRTYPWRVGAKSVQVVGGHEHNEGEDGVF